MSSFAIVRRKKNTVINKIHMSTKAMRYRTIPQEAIKNTSSFDWQETDH